MRPFLPDQVRAFKGSHDHLVSVLDGFPGNAGIMPDHQGGRLGKAAFPDFIPADDLLAARVDQLFHAVDEVALELLFVFQAVFLHHFLGLGGVFPLLFGGFVSAYVDVGGIREELADFF